MSISDNIFPLLFEYINRFIKNYLFIKDAIDQSVIKRPTPVKKIVLLRYIFSLLLFLLKKAARFPATIAAPTPNKRRIIVKSSANGSFITYIMIMNMIESSEVVKIFLDYEISNIKDEKKYTILPPRWNNK